MHGTSIRSVGFSGLSLPYPAQNEVWSLETRLQGPCGTNCRLYGSVVT